jgi:dsDNA-specific endonuclease/ATPase MutS2
MAKPAEHELRNRTRVKHIGPLVLVLLLVASAFAVGCGESDAEKAQDDVCDARADLEQQIDNLAGLTLTSESVEKIQDIVNAVEEDLQQIADAQADLSEERRQEVESATEEFTSEFEAVADDVGEDLSLSEGTEKVESAATQLAASYEETFATIDCG